jgi:hypothetical protein
VDRYKDQLHVGPSPGVAFSYGELLAMGDLFATVDQMQAAPLAELTKLKDLIQRSTRYYEGGKKDDSLDVSHKEWDDTTAKRYRALAEENYEHFAPDTLFGSASLPHGNHRSAWEAHHRRAIAEAQRLALLPENQNRSYVPEWPLIINAFGDHFLTDAFASGHLINKDVVLERFKAAFYSGGKLNKAAGGFLERLAAKAFVGKVKDKFSPLEMTGTKLGIHWNIDTTNAFRKLLVEIAEREPDQIANLALKAVHDHLNTHGVAVTNGAGDAWTVTGDTMLTPQTLAIMRKAVAQSMDNLADPAILVSNLNVDPFVARVWRYTPQLTPSSRTEVQRLVGEYTNPASTLLVDAAARIITAQVDYLIDVLVNEKHELRHE